MALFSGPDSHGSEAIPILFHAVDFDQREGNMTNNLTILFCNQ